MAAHAHWTRHLPDSDDQVTRLATALECDTEQIADLNDRVEALNEQRLQYFRSADVHTKFDIRQIELAKALVGPEMVQGVLRAANLLQLEARFLLTTTPEVTERLADTIADKTEELIVLIKQLETASVSLQLLASTPR